jgi:hypothetical protein
METIILNLKFDFENLWSDFRNLILEQCDWTLPTYYRNVREERMSNVEKSFYLKAGINLVVQILHRHRKVFRGISPEAPLYYSLEDCSLRGINSAFQQLAPKLRQIMLKKAKCSKSNLYKWYESKNIKKYKAQIFFKTVLWMLKGVLAYCRKCQDFYGLNANGRHKIVNHKRIKFVRVYSNNTFGKELSNQHIISHYAISNNRYYK